jgi:hypothetical protein
MALESRVGRTEKVPKHQGNLRKQSVVAAIHSRKQTHHKGPSQASKEGVWGTTATPLAVTKLLQWRSGARRNVATVFPQSFGTFSANLHLQTLQKLPVVMSFARLIYRNKFTVNFPHSKVFL